MLKEMHRLIPRKVLAAALAVHLTCTVGQWIVMLFQEQHQD